MNILLVEVDLSLRSSLIQTLREHRYQPSAVTAKVALALVKLNPYGLIVLDAEAMESEGISLCRQLRSLGYTNPILMLIRAKADGEAIAGFEAGANDYLEKPVDLSLFLSKIRTWLRRSGAAVGTKERNGASGTQPFATTCDWGALSLDWQAARITWQDQEIPLTSTEYKLLELLLRNPDRIFSRSAILDRLWDDEAPTERAINTYVKDIRKKLKTAGLTEEIIETVYGMGYRLKPLPARSGGLSPQMKALNPRILALMQQFRERLPERLKILDQANAALKKGQQSSTLLDLAQQEAHKLAGSLAGFGYPNGSTLARSIEHLLRLNRTFSPQEIEEFGQRVNALQEELNLPADLETAEADHPSRVCGTGAGSAPAKPCWLLVIDDDADLTDRLVLEGPAWGLSLEVLPDPSLARPYLEQFIPDAVLLDLSFPDTEEDGLAFLHHLRTLFPKLPVVVFTGRNSLHDRLAVSRLGAQGFLHKPATIAQIFEKVQQVLPQRHSPEAKVLIVDDDLDSLDLLTTLLSPWGLTLVTLNDPRRFWDVLLETRPDLVLLDLEMPMVSGLELCQIVRQDAEWGNLPLLVVTAHTNAHALQQAFAAGADDFIPKPVLGAELVTRVLSRLKRY
ncbi:MAG: response regulator [Prochlorotrichaceae cyanobacterium]|jgi:DNA-binding response OmpR family regulator/HPt (histidine-containing phosphotransfer) domain-containing protein